MSIENRINKITDDTIKELWLTMKEIIDDSNEHLAEITTQLPEFDKHDKSHSVKVLQNIEKLLQDEGIERLTPIEAIFLYAAAYMHDVAMALPMWEYRLLEAAEGTDDIYDDKKGLFLNNDFKPVHDYSKLHEFIVSNKKELYKDFETASKFVFAPGTEKDLVEDLVSRVREYEGFRNEYTDKLKLLTESKKDYLNYSALIRREFIRTTHHTRIEYYIKKLKLKLEQKIGAVKANCFVESLSKICRSHGENFDFIKETKYHAILWGQNYVNEQYVSMLLRLGDIIHFSSDRAPLSLFAEKQITDSESLKHWKAKFQDLTYDITLVKSKIQISFSAYCSEPDIYYFIQDYMDDIDREFEYYRSIIENYRFSGYDPALIEAYELPFELVVNREGIVPDKEIFIPDSDAKFTLEQAKILQLLMGTQLYKDKYLCLRELYQNSLDACKCMIAENNKKEISQSHKIEFGLKQTESDGKKETYIYCADNGTGMTKEIVKNYLLNIGNSYYKSKEFLRENAGWSNNVVPTSQFGIGILSCYMIGKRIEITTKHHKSDDIFAFSLDGINERFYYKNIEQTDKERIGQHGTIVKIFLNDETQAEINNEYHENMDFLIRYGSEELQNCLFYIVNKQIGFPYDKISVSVCDNEETPCPVISHADALDYNSITDENRSSLVKKNTIFEDFIANYDNLKLIDINVSNGEVELYSKIYLPKRDSLPISAHMLSYMPYIWGIYNNIYVDGICVSSTDGKAMNNFNKLIGDTLRSNLYFNYIGESRPTLSVDRNSIVSFDTSLIDNNETAFEMFTDKLTEKINEYIIAENIDKDSWQFKEVIELITNKYVGISSRILRKLNIDFAIPNIKMNGENCFANKFFNEKKLVLTTNVRALSHTENILILNKFVSSSHIEVNDADIFIDDAGSTSCLSEDNCYFLECSKYSINSNIVKADIWKGLYQEYDFVSSLFPLIPARVFEKINVSNYNKTPIQQDRFKRSDIFRDICIFEPALINPSDYGISYRGHYSDQEIPNRIGKLGAHANFKLANYLLVNRSEKKTYVLFAFISPDKLNDEEKESLKNCADDIYVRGVKEGWSILFIGSSDKQTIMPGIVKKSDIMAKALEEHGEFIESKREVLHNFDDTLAFPLSSN